MKIFRSRLFYFLIGIILSGSVAYAAGRINANQIKYIDKDNNEITVDTALNNLYTEADKDILTRLNLSSSKVSYNESQGSRIPNRSTTLDLTAGSYLVFASYHFTGGTTGTNVVNNNNDYVILNYNNGNCTRLSGRYAIAYISSFGGGNANLSDNEVLASYICKFNQSLTLTITSNMNVSENDSHESHIMAQAIKLD